MKKRLKKLLILMGLLSILTACSKNDTSPSNTEIANKDTISEMEEAEFFFSSKNFANNEIDTSIFKDYDLTLVNIWGTFCSPCIEEIPALEEVYKNKPENVNVLGLAIDVIENDKDTKNLELAISMLEDLGANYTNIQNNQELDRDVIGDVHAVPSTVFIDRNGNFVGDTIIGIPVRSSDTSEIADAYLDIIKERLEIIE